MFTFYFSTLYRVFIFYQAKDDQAKVHAADLGSISSFIICSTHYLSFVRNIEHKTLFLTLYLVLTFYQAKDDQAKVHAAARASAPVRANGEAGAGLSKVVYVYMCVYIDI